ncbi:MAG: TraR/DksA family transcriptional regulator [bacterium]
MNTKDLEYFKNDLLEKHKEVLAQEGMLESDGINNSGNTDSGDFKYATHFADLGSDTVGKELSSYLKARTGEYLKHLDLALERIERGSYGPCLSCGEEIQKERLEVVPHTRYCVSCKDKNN